MGDNKVANQLAVLATMIEGLDFNTLIEYSDWDNVDGPTIREAVVLADGHLGSSVRAPSLVPALQPDILGEWFVLSSFSGLMKLKPLVLLAWKLAPQKMARFLLHCIQDFSEHPKIFQLLDVAPVQEEGQAAYAAASPSIFSYLNDGNREKYPRQLICALERGGNNNDSEAIYLVGICYEKGFGVKADSLKAVEWYRKAANAGNSRAMVNLGVCYQNGVGGKVDPRKAMKWYRKAADAGDSRAMFNLGFCYQNGDNVEADPHKAVEWYHKAVDAGDSLAMTNLGVCYQNGVGGKVDPRKAVEWYHKAADAGDSLAMIYLGLCYQNGVGVEADPQKTVEWYRKAAEAGHAEALKHIEVHPDNPGLEPEDPFLAQIADGLKSGIWPLEPLIAGEWIALSGEASHEALCAISSFSSLMLRDDFQLIALRATALSFYPSFQLVEALFNDGTDPRIACVIFGSRDIALIMNGTLDPIYFLNAFNRPCLDSTDIIRDYLRFNCMAACSPEGSFRLIDELEECLFTEKIRSKDWEKLSSQVKPLKLTAEKPEKIEFSGTVLYAGSLSQMNFVVMRRDWAGMIEILDDKLIAEDLPVYREGFEGLFRFRRKPSKRP